MVRRHIIVGIDPGTTVGLAMLDLHGEICALHSSKDMSIDDIVERIIREGLPVIIATDVETLPQTVEKVSASFEARLHIPRNPISLREKNELARGQHVSNAHERDALAAAVKAYLFYKPKFDNIDARLVQAGKVGLSEEVKALTLKEYYVTEAIAMLEPPPPPQAGEGARKGPPQDEHAHPPIGPLKARIRNQKAYIGELELRILGLRKTIQALEREIAGRNESARIKAIESAVVHSKNRRISRLEKDAAQLRTSNRRLMKELKALRGIQKLKVHRDLIVCHVLRRFSGPEIDALCKATGIKEGDVLFVEDSSGGGASTANKVAALGVTGIITQTEMSHTAREILELQAVAVFNAAAFAIRREGPVAILEKKQFDEAYASWAHGAQQKERARQSQWLEGLIDTYRHERKKGKK